MKISNQQLLENLKEDGRRHLKQIEFDLRVAKKGNDKALIANLENQYRRYAHLHEVKEMTEPKQISINECLMWSSAIVSAMFISFKCF